MKKIKKSYVIIFGSIMVISAVIFFLAFPSLDLRLSSFRTGIYNELGGRKGFGFWSVAVNDKPAKETETVALFKDRNYIEISYEVKCSIFDDLYLEVLIDNESTVKQYLPCGKSHREKTVLTFSGEPRFDNKILKIVLSGKINTFMPIAWKGTRFSAYQTNRISLVE